jgi:hypothetical protein
MTATDRMTEPIHRWIACAQREKMSFGSDTLCVIRLPHPPPAAIMEARENGHVD